ncbi:hypothetical protein AUK40_04460 [Candidatus Wirthbacteria bacterium CG2_30_54_11]|uniref:Uncharacterized protein n=1 Tax=Candidatus Wirthbacteria bacterium CG2_30_54_11 TaxID=1817892 RepID=A0A1J5IJK8_9BACT|nr:MAG: hypothetical protein AUK40_04460 [Candidatus Wirthbacteria bacterium CG2_30_54_11]
MGNTIIKVANMHCGSCARMIRMEIEDDTTPGLAAKVIRVETTDPATQTGEVELAGATEADVTRVKELIVKAGYQAV